jgi:hypothetical protein
VSATALLQITQGATVGADGEALKGNTADDVVFSNADDTDVATWKFELLYVPPGSALTPTTQGPNATATFNMGTPDVPGCYRVRLTVTDADGNESVDIRNFAVPTPNRDWIIPPDQRDPPPLPLSGTGSKPDELNFGGQAFGWQGDDDAARKLLYAILLEIDANL